MKFQIFCEDDTPLNESFDLIVPFSMIADCDSETVDICVYDRFRLLAEAFAERYTEDPFGEEAQRYLASVIHMPLSNLGYGAPVHRRTVLYTADPGYLPPISTAAALPIAEIGDEIEDLTVLEIDPTLPGFGTVQNGSLVSAAVCNDPMFDLDSDSVEIAVETAEPYRRSGCGAANVAALAAALTAQGKTIRYQCSADNLPSRRTAERAGLTFRAEQYYLCAYLN